MEIFNGEKLVYKIRINYKSGISEEIWASEFKIHHREIEFVSSYEPDFVKEIERRVYRLSRYDLDEILLLVIENDPKRSLYVGFDDIESVYQVKTKSVPKFSTEFMTKWKEYIKKFE